MAEVHNGKRSGFFVMERDKRNSRVPTTSNRLQNRSNLISAFGRRHLAFHHVMLNFNPYNLLAGFIFGTLGWGAFAYGKRLELWQPRAIGLALMIYPYFITREWLLWGTGVGLLVLLWFYHHE
jgi:hypothetical protein